MTVVAATEKYVSGLPDQVKRTPEAELALNLAGRLDGCDDKPAASMSRELTRLLGELKKMAEATGINSEVSTADELKARRAARMAAAQDPPPAAEG